LPTSWGVPGEAGSGDPGGGADAAAYHGQRDVVLEPVEQGDDVWAGLIAPLGGDESMAECEPAAEARAEACGPSTAAAGWAAGTAAGSCCRDLRELRAGRSPRR
jgi:hypothetical protein